MPGVQSQRRRGFGSRLGSRKTYCQRKGLAIQYHVLHARLQFLRAELPQKSKLSQLKMSRQISGVTIVRFVGRVSRSTGIPGYSVYVVDAGWVTYGRRPWISPG